MKHAAHYTNHNALLGRHSRDRCTARTCANRYDLDSHRVMDVSSSFIHRTRARRSRSLLVRMCSGVISTCRWSSLSLVERNFEGKSGLAACHFPRASVKTASHCAPARLCSPVLPYTVKYRALVHSTIHQRVWASVRSPNSQITCSQFWVYF